MELLEGWEEGLLQSRTLGSKRLEDLSVEIEHFNRRTSISLNPAMSCTMGLRHAKTVVIGPH